jgi:hypothetical protein
LISHQLLFNLSLNLVILFHHLSHTIMLNLSLIVLLLLLIKNLIAVVLLISLLCTRLINNWSRRLDWSLATYVLLYPVVFHMSIKVRDSWNNLRTNLTRNFYFLLRDFAFMIWCELNNEDCSTALAIHSFKFIFIISSSSILLWWVLA